MTLPDFGSLPAQFERGVPGRTLILDGDGFAYQASATVKKLTTALTRYQTLIETERFLTGAETVRIHLTPRGCKKCHRADYPTVLKYQAGRSREKPPLLEPLRAAIAQHEWPEHWSVFSWYDREADDGMVMDSVAYGSRGIILSPDKDLRLAPGPYWEMETGQLDVIADRFGWISTKQLTSSVKVIGHGTKFFWAQMLMGDSADSVRGIRQFKGKTCGPGGAYAALASVTDESEAANLVLRAYAQIQQDPLAEAQCLWLRRSMKDCAYTYLCELNLDLDLRAWLDALHAYHTEVLALKAQLKDQERGEDQSETSAGPEARRCVEPLDLPWN